MIRRPPRSTPIKSSAASDVYKRQEYGKASLFSSSHHQNHCIECRMPYHEYLVVGRHAPSEKDPNPKIYKMKLFAKNPILAKSRFWYFVSVQKKVKKASGQILKVSEIFERRPNVIKNFSIFCRYTSKTGTQNMFKEYRDTTRVGAVQQLYQDLAGSYRARFRNIQIMSVDAVKAAQTRRASTKQFVNSKIKFPLPHRVLKAPSRKYRPTFSAKRPQTHF
eukprot:TRINITY_DN9_c0_g1_i1.p1 TRINITY_DN9_c0_g1~~TRINITY_DN9_c0_g1_i1.p1  ORF type:complete len:220 (-),score=42.37 TRINITY_DN9_c0_g1_i1:59-718(-)